MSDAALPEAGPSGGRTWKANLCANCFAEPGGQRRSICPVCGWDNSTPQPPEALRACLTVVASRYQVGRAKADERRGHHLRRAGPVHPAKLVELREFFPHGLAARRAEDGTVAPRYWAVSQLFDQYLDQFLDLAEERQPAAGGDGGPLGAGPFRGKLHGLRGRMNTRQQCHPAALRGECSGGSPALEHRQPDVPAQLLPSWGLSTLWAVSHLGISPDTLRVTGDGTVLITGRFSIAGGPARDGLGPGGRTWPPALPPGSRIRMKARVRRGQRRVRALARHLCCTSITGQAPREAHPPT